MPELREEAKDLGISIKDGGGKNKGKDELAHDVKSALMARRCDLSAAALLHGNRLEFADDEADAASLAQAAVRCASYKVTGPQLLAILGGRLKMIGREVRIFMQTYPAIVRAMDPAAGLIDGALVDAIKLQQKEIDAHGAEVKRLTELVESGDEAAPAALEAALEASEKVHDDMDLLIADRATVAAGALHLQPELERYMAYLKALTDLVKPWVAPPATSKEKWKVLEGNEDRVRVFLRLQGPGRDLRRRPADVAPHAAIGGQRRRLDRRRRHLWRLRGHEDGQQSRGLGAGGRRRRGHV